MAMQISSGSSTVVLRRDGRRNLQQTECQKTVADRQKRNGTSRTRDILNLNTALVRRPTGGDRHTHERPTIYIYYIGSWNELKTNQAYTASQ